MRRRFLLSAVPASALMARAGFAAAAQSPVTVGIIGGPIDGTFMRVAADLTSVMNSDTLRVVPIVGKGSLQNLDDILHVPGIDLALVSADALAYAQASHLDADSLSRIQYICKLYDSDVHVCGRPEIRSLADLQGKPVNIDVPDSGTNLAARAIFSAAGVAPDFRFDEPEIGQDALRRGTIAANVFVAGKPVRLFADMPGDSGLHFVPVPTNEALERTYLPGGLLTHADYPALVRPEDSVETIGVGVTLVVSPGAPGSARYRNLMAFVDTFFSKFPALLKPPHHPVWHDVNLAAAQPGWTRFAPAAAWLAQHAPRSPEPSDAETRAEFDAFLAQRGVSNLTPAEREATWRYFQEQLRNFK